MKFAEIVEQKKVALMRENMEELRKNLYSVNALYKVQEFIKRVGNILTVEQVLEQIATNDVVAANFCKNPAKQNVSENLCAELLGWKRLPSNGPASIRFDRHGDESDQTLGRTKAADFYEQGYYITQKYTNGVGGGQDNQLMDVMTFLLHGSIDHKVCAVLDGEYFENGKREELKKAFYFNHNVVITSVDEIIENGGRIERPEQDNALYD